MATRTRPIFPPTVLALLAFATAPAAAAQLPPAPEDVDAARYGDCMALAGRKPEAAFESAITWRAENGGLAAEHCAATALNALGQHAEAGHRFEEIAQGLARESAFRATILGHAARAWLLAGMPERALTVLDAALGLDANNPGLLVDRAEAHAARKEYKAAAADLDRALGLDPYDVDALVFRAAARRYLEDTAGARADVDRALQLEPANPEALLERGILRRLAGDDAGARADWTRIATDYPDDPAARAAQRNLELLDGRTGER